MGGGGGSSSSTTDNRVTVNTQTDVNVDLLPLGEVLAESNKQASINEKEAQTIALINSELTRQVDKAKMLQLDTYLEHAKNGIVLSLVAGALIYTYNKKRR